MTGFERSEGIPHYTNEMLRARFGDLSSLLKRFPWLPEGISGLSNHFIHAKSNSERQTPWQRDSAIESYLAYFHVLNSVRMTRILRELFLIIPGLEVNSVLDFGSGLGSSHCALLSALRDSSSHIKPTTWHFVEQNPMIRKTHRALLEKMNFNLKDVSWHSTIAPSMDPVDLFISSYSLNELEALPKQAIKAQNIILLEASENQSSRELMALRDPLIAEGFEILAPCTHQLACPLLVHSKRDFCHDRIGFEAPTWFHKLEEKLPIKNRSLTFSYLVASKSQQSFATGLSRVIGDTLIEKGKTRQMICRKDEREYLSWLKRHGRAPRIPHGSLLEIPDDIEKKGVELRASGCDLKPISPATLESQSSES